MGNNTKKEKDTHLSTLQDVVKEFIYKGRIPQRYEGDKKKLDALISHYDKKLITPEVINQTISDISFKEVLDKVKHDDDRYKGNTKLGSIKEVDVVEITKSVNKLLSSIPINYNFILRLPKCEKPIKTLKLAHNVEIITADEELIKLYFGEKGTEKGLRRLLSDFNSGGQKINIGDLLLKVSGKGYVGEYGLIKLDVIDPLYIWKVIIGVYAGFEILTKQSQTSYFRLAPEFTYDVYDKAGLHIRSLNESTEDNQYISRMQFDLKTFEPTEIDKLLNKTNTPFDYANEVLKNLFSEIRFAGNKTDKDVVKQQRMLKNGAYWFFESLKTQQDHVRVIYMTTAFDSLLGARGNDDTKESKAELIAVSVSKDSLEGDGIRKAIIELYAYRNEIIHGSKEISSLDQYGEWDEKPTKANMYYSLSILMRFLRKRIYFVNGGLARVSKFTTRV